MHARAAVFAFVLAVAIEHRPMLQDPICVNRPALQEPGPLWHLRTHLILGQLFESSAYNIPEREVGHASPPGRNRGHYEFDPFVF
jgi:hypothetical protein